MPESLPQKPPKSPKNAIEMFIRGEAPDDSAPTEDEIIEVRQIETDDDSALI